MFTRGLPCTYSPLERWLKELLRAQEWPVDPGVRFYVVGGFHKPSSKDGRVRPFIAGLLKRPLSGALADELDDLEQSDRDFNDSERRVIHELRIKLRRRAEFQETQSARYLAGDEQTKPQDDVHTVEYGFVHRIHPNTAAVRLAETRETARLPELMKLLERGEIDLGHLRAAAWESLPLSDEAAAEFDRRLAAKATKLSISETRNEARKAAMEVDPEHARQQAESTRKSADVKVVHHTSGDGADLIATGPAADIAEMMAAINTRAGLDENDDSMKAGCRRFHALKSLIQGGLDQVLACNHCGQVVHNLERGSKRRRARNRVVVTIPDRTLKGEADSPGNVEGTGPIDATEARRFAAQPGTTFHRLFYDPATGVATNFDPKRYRLTPSESDLLAYRDGVCMAPGCGRPATLCESDHVFEAGAGGPTDLSNLQSLCDQSHDDKTQHGVTAEQKPDGTGQIWTTPLGGRFEKDYRDHRPQPPGSWPEEPTF